MGGQSQVKKEKKEGTDASLSPGRGRSERTKKVIRDAKAIEALIDGAVEEALKHEALREYRQQGGE